MRKRVVGGGRWVVVALALAAASSLSAASFWCTQFKIGCPASAGFVPTYVTPTPTLNNGFGLTQTLNPWYFADQTTATALCKRLMAPGAVDSCAYTYTQPCEMGGGPATCSAPEIWLMFRDGLKENAGLLAANFTRNPEGAYPGVAMNLINAQLMADQKALPQPSAPQGFLLRLRRL